MTATATIDARLISLSLLDEPRLPMRAEIGGDKFDELVASVRQNGVVEPLIVRPSLGRFEIIAGHRRFWACKHAGLVEAPCVVRDVDDATVEQLKVAENVDRDDVNPAHEATYLAEVMMRFCEDSTDRLALFVNRSRGYVESRLLLLRGFPEVLAAVAANQITLSAADVLNRFPDRAGMLMYLEQAKTGVAARVIKGWLQDYENFAARNAGVVEQANTPASTVAGPAIYSGPICVCCGVDEERPRLMAIYVHDYCNKAILEKMLRAYKGDGNGPAT